MLRHGVETDIVELDPAVYKYAIDYFGLLTNHTAYIEDAVGCVDKRAKQESPELYDYVIHDVFTGGAAPAALFTKEMVEGMSKIMKPDGVIAIVSSYPEFKIPQVWKEVKADDSLQPSSLRGLVSTGA